MPVAAHDSTDLFLRAILAIGRRVRSERPPGSLSLSGLGILGTLNRRGPLVATELAAEQRLKPQSLTRLLADLAGERFISRTRSVLDGRAMTITITAKGQQVLMEDIAQRRAWLDSAMSASLSSRERTLIRDAAIVILKLSTYEPSEDAE
jgi:DNA-binding MarR family transcriptional regulator